MTASQAREPVCPPRFPFGLDAPEPAPMSEVDMLDAAVKVSSTRITVDIPERGVLDVGRGELPADFLAWQSRARIGLFERLESKGSRAVSSLPAHLPVLATWGDGPFPVNLATRGVGLLPREDRLRELTDMLRSAASQIDRTSWAASLPRRVAAIRTFYDHPELFETRLLGGLEIFERRTAVNLIRWPLASLLFTAEAPEYTSYQINCAVERVAEDNPHYRFLLAARELFAFDAFHIHQSRYPVGYLFHVVEVLDKKPFSRRHPAGAVGRDKRPPHASQDPSR
jgi:hypothetical protein